MLIYKKVLDRLFRFYFILEWSFLLGDEVQNIKNINELVNFLTLCDKYELLIQVLN